MSKTFVDFFAGIGLVEHGLRKGDWEHLISVDYSELKLRAYNASKQEASQGHYLMADVFNISGTDIPDCFLAHASFPCTDVSAAGSRAGSQDGKESSAIDSFLRIIDEMADRKPSMVLLENVKGLISSHDGKDLRFLIKRLNRIGYVVDLLCIDAKHFVPQSRERVFIVGHHKGFQSVSAFDENKLNKMNPSKVRDRHVINFITNNKDLDWYLHELPSPGSASYDLSEIVDSTEKWWPRERTDYLLSQMFERHRNWLEDRKDSTKYHFGSAFRRMRVRDGVKKSTAELRTDGIAGCLRTAKGGSAKQILIRAGKGNIDARLISPKECARLMGADYFHVSEEISVSDWLYCFGDAVCVSVIEWLDQHYLTPFYETYHPEVKETLKLIEKGNIEMENDLLEALQEFWYNWSASNKDRHYGLPHKGCIYAALVVLDTIEDESCSLENLDGVKSTDPGQFFGRRSLKNHTNHRVKMIISSRGKPHLDPGSGELGRTSGGTKTAALETIQAVADLTKRFTDSTHSREERSQQVTSWLFDKLIDSLEQYHQLGGIDVKYSSNETLSAFIRKILEFPRSNPGAIYQHMVGAKLEVRYENDDVNIQHHGASTADVQTGRLGDFEVGSTVFHVTKTPNADHLRKAYKNTESGYRTYLLVPKNILSSIDATAQNNQIADNFSDKVEVFSVEQFVAQNLDEIAIFDRSKAVQVLKNMLDNYNALIEKYENDNSLKIIIPDLGV